MAKSQDRSLGELETLYKEKIRGLAGRRDALVSQLNECEKELRAYEEKLHWVRTLITSPDSAAVPARPGKKKRRRKSPVRDLVRAALANRRGQWLTAAEVRSAIRKDSNKGVSRQSINTNLNQLVDDGEALRKRAPKGSGGAWYVFSIA